MIGSLPIGEMALLSLAKEKSALMMDSNAILQTDFPNNYFPNN